MLWWWLIYALICGLLLLGWSLSKTIRRGEGKARKRAKAKQEANRLKKLPIERTNVTPEELLMLIELDKYHREGDN